MQIETVGLPGVGKTTYMSSIELDDYKIIYSKARGLSSRLLSRPLFIFVCILAKIFGIDAENLFLRKLALRLSLRFHFDKIIFFDSGFAQLFLEEIISNNGHQYDNYVKMFNVLTLFFARNTEYWICVRNEEDILTSEINRFPRRFNFDRQSLRVRYKRGAQFLKALKKTKACIIINLEEVK